jgi:hypothetical protein
MNSFGESMFFEQADTAWFLYLRQHVQQGTPLQAEVHTSARGVRLTLPAHPVTRTTDFRFDTASAATRYNNRVVDDPTLCAQYEIRDLSRVKVRPGASTSPSGDTKRLRTVLTLKFVYILPTTFDYLTMLVSSSISTGSKAATTEMLLHINIFISPSMIMQFMLV